jgi:ribosome-associated toxin RatA of RatAB toxin-antitoxin module
MRRRSPRGLPTETVLRVAIALAFFAALGGVGVDVSHAQAAQVQARRDGEAVLVDAVADVPGDPRIAWDVLTAYERYPEFVPDLQESRIVSRGPNTASVAQRGTAGWLFYRIPLAVNLTVTEQPYERVRSVATGGDFLEFSGSYRLLPSSRGVRVEYSGRMVPAFWLPPVIGLPALRAMVTRQFNGLMGEIERRSHPPASAHP